MSGQTEPQAIQVSLAIINYNGADHLPALLRSLQRQTHPPAETVLVDNASADNSLKLVAADFPWVQALPQTSNLGFARAANLAAARCRAAFIVFLNTDLEAEERWLEELVDRARADDQIAAVAPKMRLAGRPQLLNGVGGGMNMLGYTWDRGMLEEDRGQYDESSPVLFAPAAASLFRRDVFLELGGFDERFFMYHEDVDFGWRCWLAGYCIVTEPKAVVYHHFGGSTRVHRTLLWREVLGERNNIRSLLKNYEVRNAVRMVIRLMALRQRWPRKLAQIRNLLWNLVFLPETLRLRRAVQRRRKRRDRELEALILQSPHVPVRF